MTIPSDRSSNHDLPLLRDDDHLKWIGSGSLALWLIAAVEVFVPFARYTSAWNALTLRVPGEQGNWWHVLVGYPFFLAYLLCWIKLRYLFTGHVPTLRGRRFIWSMVAISICATVMVEIPFMFRLAGTSASQRHLVVSLGFGIMLASATWLAYRRNWLTPTQRCVVGLITAYISNTALCLVVYSEATGTFWSRAGWLLSSWLIWPMAIELVWILGRAGRDERSSEAERL